MNAAATSEKPKKDLSGLMPYLRRYKGGIVLGLASVVLMSLLGNLIPLATGVITDTLRGDPVPFQHASDAKNVVAHPLSSPALSRLIPYYAPSNRNTLAIYCILIVICVTLKGLLSFWARWVLIGVSRDIEFDIRSDLLDRLLIMEPEFYVRNRTGELMSRATNDLNAGRMVLGPGIMYTGTTVITMVLSIFILTIISPSLTLWVLLPVPVAAFAVRHFGKVIHELYEKIQASLATLSAKVQENLSGVRVIRAYAQEDAEVRGFDEPNREYVAKNMQLIKTWSMFMPSLTALIGTTFLIVLWQGGYRYLHGQMSLGA